MQNCLNANATISSNKKTTPAVKQDVGWNGLEHAPVLLTLLLYAIKREKLSRLIKI